MSQDAKKDEFRKYLEKAGVLEILTKSLVQLYEEPDKPSDALSYLKTTIGGEAEDKITVEQLQQENEGLVKKVEDLQTSNNALENRLKDLQGQQQGETEVTTPAPMEDKEMAEETVPEKVPAEQDKPQAPSEEVQEPMDTADPTHAPVEEAATDAPVESEEKKAED